MPHARKAYDFLMTKPFKTVIDVGCGMGTHSINFAESGKLVTMTDWKATFDGITLIDGTQSAIIEGDYNELYIPEQFDAVWCAHVLEHQLNHHDFLKKLIGNCKEGGWIAITVPPLKHEIVGGHVTLWNCGLLTYNLVLAGLDCSNISLSTYGYNCSAVIQKRSVEVPWKNLYRDNGDMQILEPYLPSFLKHGTRGDIDEWNWQ